ncbi:hypothetical protein TWF694_003261 [Orbilia ellipsospora]|uniref:Uncharacterized protein n=1 Tax=Orbilia ellipsospora TaxID=2528407 RepID=A0AAV9X3H2_9PEZI
MAFPPAAAGMTAQLTIESSTNGVWAGILASYKTFANGYFICPEVYVNVGTANPGKADLVIRKVNAALPNNTGEMIFVYEGKKAGTTTDIYGAATQLKGYLKDQHIKDFAGRRYGMVAVGNLCAFVVYNGGTTYYYINAGTVHPNPNATTMTVYQVGTHNNQISQILTYLNNTIQ